MHYEFVLGHISRRARPGYSLQLLVLAKSEELRGFHFYPLCNILLDDIFRQRLSANCFMKGAKGSRSSSLKYRLYPYSILLEILMKT